MGKYFVEQFERLGARLVMFFDGATVERKRTTWVERRLRSLQDVYRVFDDLNSGKEPTSFPKHLFQLPPEVAQMSRGLFKLLCGCEVRNSIRECDEEIVEYAQRNNCFAILGQDTDYVIYGGAQYYLSMMHLDVDTMTTYNYSRWALARNLHISPYHLPMLASLIGNDLISTNNLKEFHQRISGAYSPPLHVVIDRVAAFVRTLPIGPLLVPSLPGVAQTVFGDQRWAPQLETSVRSYHVDVTQPPERVPTPADHWERVVARARELHTAADIPHLLLAVMTGLPYELSTGMEDFRRLDLPPAALALCTLRQRTYGLLLHERPDTGMPAVEEWCTSGPDSLQKPDIVMALPVPGHHPGLLALWEDRSEDMQDVRWRLFTSAVAARLPCDHFRGLPPHLVVPAAALHYLHNELGTPVMLAWEVDALIAQAVLVGGFSAERLAQLPGHLVDTRAVRLAMLFQRAIVVQELGTPVMLAWEVDALIAQAVLVGGFSTELLAQLPGHLVDTRAVRLAMLFQRAIVVQELGTPVMLAWEVDTLIAQAVLVGGFSTERLAQLPGYLVDTRAVRLATLFQRAIVVQELGTPVMLAWEVDALIAQAVLVGGFSTERLAQLPGYLVDTRAVRLATLFQRAIVVQELGTPVMLAWEVDALIAQAVLVGGFSTERLAQLPGYLVDTRAVRLATLFQRAIVVQELGTPVMLAWEVDALIAQAVLVGGFSTERLAQLPGYLVDTRAVRLATLFQRAIVVQELGTPVMLAWEVDALIAQAVLVGGFSAERLAQLPRYLVDTRAVRLATLFQRAIVVQELGMPVMLAWEVDALIAQAVLVGGFSTERLAQLPGYLVDTRAVRLATLFQRAIVVQELGMPVMLAWEVDALIAQAVLVGGFSTERLAQLPGHLVDTRAVRLAMLFQRAIVVQELGTPVMLAWEVDALIAQAVLVGGFSTERLAQLPGYLVDTRAVRLATLFQRAIVVQELGMPVMLAWEVDALIAQAVLVGGFSTERLAQLPGYLVDTRAVRLATLFQRAIVVQELGTPVMLAWEVDALIAQAVLVGGFSTKRLAQLPGYLVDTRAVRLATLFQRATRTVVFLLAVCGYPVTPLQTMSWQYFDGKLFQAAYRLAKSEASDSRLCDNMVEAMEQLQQIRRAVFVQ